MNKNQLMSIAAVFTLTNCGNKTNEITSMMIDTLSIYKTQINAANHNLDTIVSIIMNDDNVNLSLKDRLALFEYAIENTQAVINAEFNATPLLSETIKRGWSDIAICLVNHGANVNALDQYRKTPLDYVEEDYVEEDSVRQNMIKKAIDNGVSNPQEIAAAIYRYYISPQRKQSSIALNLIQYAIKNGYKDDTKKNAFLGRTNTDNNTLLHWVVNAKFPEVVKYIIDNGADVNAENNAKATPLMWAAKKDNSNECLEIVKYLVDKDADLDKKDENGKTALHIAINFENNVIAKYLIDEGEKKLNEKLDIKNWLKGIFGWAKESNNLEIIQYVLVKKGGIKLDKEDIKELTDDANQTVKVLIDVILKEKTGEKAVKAFFDAFTTDTVNDANKTSFIKFAAQDEYNFLLQNHKLLDWAKENKFSGADIIERFN